MYYFGKYPDTYDGHCLYDENGRKVYECHLPNDFPVKDYILDGGLLPPKLPQIEGRSTIVHINGWTILSFWDRSGDHRGNSSSNFIMRGVYEFENALELANKAFPKVFTRIEFKIFQQ